jgi:hypothetical protein
MFLSRPQRPDMHRAGRGGPGDSLPRLAVYHGKGPKVCPASSRKRGCSRSSAGLVRRELRSRILQFKRRFSRLGEMRTSLARTIRTIQSRPGGWLHLENIRKVSTGVVLSLALREGKGGHWMRGWEVSCRGVREIRVSDLDGGGIRLYRSTHPAARQYATRMAQLRCRPGGRGSAGFGPGHLASRAILGALAAAHVATEC